MNGLLLSKRPHAFAHLVRACAATAALLVSAAAAGAQAPPSGGYVTRAELQRQAAAAGDQGAAIRDRLRDGDFRVGDRIVLSTRSSLQLPQPLAEALNDTLVVRDGRMVRFAANIPDLALTGVLRSELEERVNAHLRAYLRDVTTRTEILLLANISGPVGRPGYTALAPDMLLTDALMAANGVGQDADLNRTEIKRDNEVIIERDSVRAAIRNGATLDRIGFRSGDEIAVGEERRRNWTTVLQITTAVIGLAGLLYSLSR